MGLAADLLADVPAGAVLTIDSAPIIYFFEDHPKYADHFAPVFAAAAGARITAVVSAITLSEVLAGPLGSANEVLAARYREALTRSPGWRMCAVDEEIAVSASRIRVRYRLRLPDAIQIATAIATGSHALVTHDKTFTRITDIRVIGAR